MRFDVDAIRAEFPILQRQVHGRPLVYFDNAASVQKPQKVIDCINHTLTQSYANVHRGLHTLSNEATERYEQARKICASYLGVDDGEIIFTMGGTDAINLVSYSWGMENINEGDEIILSVMEHHSNIVPWHFLRERKGAVLKWLTVDDDGAIDMDQYQSLLGPKTKLVAITGLSNVLGAAPDIKTMADMAHGVGAKILVDGCQKSVHGPVDVKALGADFYIMTGHKIYGPSGIGVVYGQRALLQDMAPYRGGGEMIDCVTQDIVTYNDPPHRFEAGTPPIMEAIALGAALEWVMGQDIEGLQVHEKALTDYAMDALSGLNWISLYGRAPDKGPVIAFNIDGAHPHDVSTIVDQMGVALRAGHHCCQPLMQHMEVSATVRASFAAYNTQSEIDIFIEAMHKVRNLLS